MTGELVWKIYLDKRFGQGGCREILRTSSSNKSGLLVAVPESEALGDVGFVFEPWFSLKDC